MSKKTKLKIGWQKYEDLVEKQLNSPLLKTITNVLMKDYVEQHEDIDEGEYEDMPEESGPIILPFSAKLLEDAAVSSIFECWVGHTNFNITNEIKNKLDSTEGVELLKICSRYRFFIGIGQMFNFQDVRKNIEDNILKEE